MKSLQFDVNNQGFLILSDLETKKLYYPSDEDGNFLNVLPEFYLSIKFVSDGVDVFPVNFISEQGLGWITAAIGAVASIGGALIGKKTSKQANQSAEKQLQMQQQIALLQAQAAEREAANPKLSTGAVVGIAIAGVAIIGSILYLINTSTNREPEQSENQVQKKKKGKKSQPV